MTLTNVVSSALVDRNPRDILLNATVQDGRTYCNRILRQDVKVL